MNTMHIDIPPIYLPIPEWNHPDCELVVERSIQELAGHGLCATDRLKRAVVNCRAGEFVSRIAPWSPVEKLQVSADMMALIFVLDDLVGDHTADPGAVAALGGAFVRTLQVPTLTLPELGMFASATRHLAERVRTVGTPTQIGRLVNTMRMWVASSAWQCALATRSDPPDLDTFLTVRLHSVGVAVVSCWFDFYTPTPLPADQLDAPVTQAFVEAMSLVCAIDNDLGSFGKERWLAEHEQGGGSDTAANIVALLMARGASRDRALLDAVSLRNKCMERLLELRDRLLVGADPVFAGWVENIVQMVRGMVDWHHNSPRYTNPDGYHPDAITMTVSLVDEPPDRTDPPPYSTINWWWHV